SNHLFLSSLFLLQILDLYIFFFSSRRRHTRSKRDWSSDVCSSDLASVFSFAAVIAFSSKSVPTAFSAPSNKAAIAKIPLPVPTRSEERRVGKECRYLWASYQYNKK